MSGLFRFLFGTCIFSFPEQRRIEVLNFLLEHGIGALSCESEGETCRLVLWRRDADAIPRELCRCDSECGLAVIFRSLLRRPGLIVGGVLAVLLLALSCLTVWRVEIKGNERLGTVEIEAALAAAGLSVGDLSPSLDIAAIKTRFLQENPGVSWIGIYIRGTTAQIELREAVDWGGEEASGTPCNLVAGADGVIERIHVDAGRASVSVGTTVRAGDLLISGIYRTATGLRTIRAEGRVLARCESTLAVLQPFTNDEKYCGEGELGGIFLEFFGKKIKLFKKSGKTDAEYDIIKRKEQIVLFGKIALPIYFECYEYIPYTMQAVVFTEEQAVRMAHSRLRAQMAARFADSEILLEQMSGEWTDTGYLLTCRVEYVEDIAVPLPYDVEINGG